MTGRMNRLGRCHPPRKAAREGAAPGLTHAAFLWNLGREQRSEEGRWREPNLVAASKQACPSGLRHQGNPVRALGSLLCHCCVLEARGPLVGLAWAPRVRGSARREGVQAGALLGSGPDCGVSGLHRVGRELAPVGAAVPLAV